MKEQKPRKQDDLDMETTFADMNVPGMPWYDRGRKKRKEGEDLQVTRKEKRAMLRAGFLALIPYILGVAGMFLLLFVVMSLWLK